VAGRVREQVEKLQVTMLRSMEVLYSIASLHQAHGRIDREPFQRFVRQAIHRQPELQALSWNPHVPAARRIEFEQAATAAGLTDFEFREQAGPGKLVHEGARAEYVPVFFIEPLDRNAPALGFDLNSDPVRRESIEQARDTGKAVATAPIRLAQESANQPGILVLLPVFRGATPRTIAERRANLEGFAVAVFRVADLVGATFGELKARGVEVQLFDQSLAGQRLFSNVTGTHPPVVAGPRPASLDVASRRWVVAFTPTREFIDAHTPQQSWLVLGGGLAFTLLATAYLYSGWRRSCDVAAANAALQEEVDVRQQAERAAACANQAKSDFLASMSHEIRTPLNAILGYAQLMQRDPALSGEQRDAIRGISTSGHHLLGLINEVLDLSKIEAGRMELNPVDFDLEALGRNLATTFKPLCAQKRISFRLETTGSARRPVCGDEGKLRQVLINLLGNAVKFTQAGEVCLRIQPGNSGQWLFEVIDTGLGIPDEEKAGIFKPFHQGSGAQHQGGTGLGLAIASRQAELLGGRLELQSERGIGSRFHFTIPLSPARSGLEAAPRMVTRLSPGTRVTALVVDDRRENRDVLGRMLTVIGCDVICAADGEDALRLARVHQPEIVFLDLLMPGLSAAETTRALRSGTVFGNPQVVAHSASMLARHRDDARAAGCVDFLAKPLRSEQLYECLQQHLGVSFEYAEPAPEAESFRIADHGTIALPESLCARLMVGAELHSATALKSALQELRQLGPEARQLAEHIRHLMRGYDMDGVQRLLAQVAVPANAATGTSPPHATLAHQRPDA
jgi:signal transduction histidine kinase/CheY-like chemotaxis protein